ncbi:MAG: hypothetical protein PHV09_05845, partial [Bacteroidales bacterium]|nr:hypothetical protein [Bacteroidales bacterium]
QPFFGEYDFVGEGVSEKTFENGVCLPSDTKMTWGPAWVTWRRANGYYGWSPMRTGISISLRFGRGYDRDRDYWMFVRDRDLQRRDISHYYIDRDNHDRIISNSTIINRTYVDSRRHSTYVSGPDRSDVQRIIGRSVRPVSIRDNSRPGQSMNNGQLQIYRPQVRKSSDRDNRPVPKQVKRPDNMRQPSVRNESSRPGNENRQTTQPQRQNNQYQRQTTQPQRQNEQYQRQAIPPQQIQKQQQREKEIVEQNVKKEHKAERKVETTQTQRTKSERVKKSEEKEGRKN